MSGRHVNVFIGSIELSGNSLFHVVWLVEPLVSVENCLQFLSEADFGCKFGQHESHLSPQQPWICLGGMSMYSLARLSPISHHSSPGDVWDACQSIHWIHRVDMKQSISCDLACEAIWGCWLSKFVVDFDQMVNFAIQFSP